MNRNRHYRTPTPTAHALRIALQRATRLELLKHRPRIGASETPAAAKAAARKERAEARDIILKLLTRLQRSVTSTELIEFTGFDKSTVHRALNYLIHRGKIHTRRMDTMNRCYLIGSGEATTPPRQSRSQLSFEPAA